MTDYYPSELTPEIVNGIFKNTVATKHSIETIRCVLFQKEHGFPQDSRPIFFDADALTERKPFLEFMLGQLKDVHDMKKSITPQSATILYNNQKWCEDNNALLSFLHLAVAAKLISPIDAKTSTLTFQEAIYPTILVSEQNFFVWQKEHKPKILKMIEEQKNDQEPADV